VYSTKREVEFDTAAANDPKRDASFQARERKVAAQEQRDYDRLKARAMDICHS
jgi:hypothetical protein